MTPDPSPATGPAAADPAAARTPGHADERVTAVVVHAACDLRVESRPLGRPANDQAIVDIAFGGICGSDLHYVSHGAAGESVLRAPLVLGHEVVGVVRTAAADGSGPVAGTRVAVHPATPGPGNGARYPLDRPNLSPGCTYLGSAAHVPHTQGAFADAVMLDSRMLRAIPAGVAFEAAALAEPAGVALHAIARAGRIAGGRVLVIGCGPIGALVIAAAQRAGAAEIVAVDVHERRLAAARAAGATRVLLAPDAQTLSEIDADAVIESSGTAAGLSSAVRGATRGGRVVLVGMLPAGEQPALLSLVITRELEMVGSYRFTDEIDEVLQALSDGSLDVHGIVTHMFDAADAAEAFGVASDPSVSGKVLLRFGAGS
ncbi:zinc-binding dehydrogenase [Planctomonas psychrotolerans]|uniref:zinc-binding dehydrogenase n=1 Tax=Planctomonas psychrotolerans TaxID=2528712 RepID=UPI001238A51B|nr:zinc-binding dehydrogenase [Planctomonas psychrotolerans]